MDESYSFSLFIGTNSSANYTCDEFENSGATHIFTICVLVVGVIGNTSLVVLSLSNRDMRTPPNLMIANLALGDLMFLVIVVPANFAFYRDCKLVMSTFMCKIYMSSTFLTQGISVYTLTALSLDRYQAIVRPLRWRLGGTSNTPRLRVSITIILIWLVSLIFTAPSLRLADIYAYGDECHMPYTSDVTRIYFSFFFIGSYCIPLIAILVFYSMTAATLLRGLRYFKQNTRTGLDRRHQSRVRLAIIILIAALSFAICWLPYHVFQLLFEFSSNLDSLFALPGITTFYTIHHMLPMVSCCLNPILLYAMSSNYRRKIKDVFRRLCGCNTGLWTAKEPLFRARTWTLISLRTTSQTRGSPPLNNRGEIKNLSLGSYERETKH